MEIKDILKQEAILEFKEDIRTMSRRKLLQHFSAASSGQAKAAVIIKNLIWQTYSLIQAGKHPLVEGNLRSYWYSHVKPTLAKVELLSSKHDHYETMLECFVEMVKTHKLFKYADIGFDDDFWEHRRLATKLLQVILFAEKTGWFRTLKELHEEEGMTVVALGGSPSLLSTEYLVKHLSEISTLDQPFYLLATVDFDPAGSIIAHSFVDQLKSQGMAKIQLINIVGLEHYSQEEIDLFKFPIPAKQKTKTKKWLETTGGINGKAFGLEADSLPRERYKKIVREALKQFKP
jgi:hypothetical protein